MSPVAVDFSSARVAVESRDFWLLIVISAARD
jgi:hypothetical protein